MNFKHILLAVQLCLTAITAVAMPQCDFSPQPFQQINQPNIEHRLRCGIDWEPTVGANVYSHSPYVYLISTAFDISLCEDKNNPVCQSNALVMRSSDTRGKSFGKESLPCDGVCVNDVLLRYPKLLRYAHNLQRREGKKVERNLFQYDPSIFVCNDKKETVLLTYLLGYIPGVVFQKSDNHGKTWSSPLPLGLTDHLLQTGGTDKPTIVANKSCSDIYVAFDGEDGNYISTSHNHGLTFSDPVRTSPVVLPGDNYHDWFSTNGVVDASGNVYFSQTLNNEINSEDTTLAIVSSSDKGLSWQTSYLGKVLFPKRCEPSAKCSVGYLTPQVVIGAAGESTAIAYTMTNKRGGNKKLYFQLNWKTLTLKEGVVLNDKGDSNFPMIVGGPKPCEYQVTWMDNRNALQNEFSNGPFNTYLKKTLDCGLTWSKEILLSNRLNATSVKYKNALGYKLPYGDYSGLAVNAYDDVFAIWGEGDTIASNTGDTWFVRP
ncbi:MAG: sialidase family protein [Gammaproteobacteria bacterium]|nr:sialidase family protein [Gammaproteobacteria bacterium]